jgi:uncharacterized damage-inducible protein DinB
MDLQTLKLLADYNRKTNGEMNGLIQKLEVSQWRQEFKGFFKSIHSLCNHIYLGDFNWLKRFSKLRSFAYIQNEVFNQDLPFSVVVFETVEDYLAKRGELDLLISDFISEIRAEDLDRYLEYVDSHGNPYTRLFGGLILHCFNHQTHHRGMISIYLESMGIENDFSNLAGMV